MTIIEQIKAEIERLKSIEYPCDNSQQATGFFNAIDRMTDFLDTLESEKPIGLEEEIHKYNKERFDEYFPEQDGDFISEVDFMTCLDRVARHFAQWGAEHLADARKTSPKDLEVAAEDFGKRQGLELRPFANKFFIAGAKWDREQMMKEAVEGEIAKDNRGNNVLRVGLLNNGFEIGDKVRIIIINQDEK